MIIFVSFKLQFQIIFINSIGVYVTVNVFIIWRLAICCFSASPIQDSPPMHKENKLKLHETADMMNHLFQNMKPMMTNIPNVVQLTAIHKTAGYWPQPSTVPVDCQPFTEQNEYQTWSESGHRWTRTEPKDEFTFPSAPGYGPQSITTATNN